MLVDSHCHLNLKVFRNDVERVIRRAFRVGVTKIVVPGVDLKTSQEAVRLSERFEGVWAAVGVHPSEAGKIERLEEIKGRLAEWAMYGRVVAIGECGLDYQWAKTQEEKRQQEEVFRQQIRLAKELGRALIVHSRGAGEETLRVLLEEKAERVVFHCFSGDERLLKRVLRAGFWVGVDGNISYSKGVRRWVKATPLSRLLLETDAPFLTPLPQRRARNEPKNVKIVADWVAKVLGVSRKEVEEQTTKNAEKFFGFKKSEE